MSEVRLQVKHVSKNFGITKALKDVSFNINKGEVHALIGENGSGKSTMTNMLTGIYTLESGQFILDGKEVHPKNQVEANEEGISIIVQELGTLSGLTVAENIFLGHEDQFVHLGIKNTAAMNKKANELLQSYGFDKIKAGDMIDDYNFEDRKLVEIVKATYFNPKIVVVDETTTALSQEGREELYKQSVSGITDRYVRVSAVKGMEIIHMQGIGGGITGTLMDGIVQNELSVGTDLGIISGFELSVPHVVLFHAHESSVIVCL